MNIKTSEEYVLAVLAERELEIERLQNKLNAFKDFTPTADISDDNSTLRNAVMIYEPTETASLSVLSYYYYQNGVLDLKELTADEILEKASTPSELAKIAEMPVAGSSTLHKKVLDINVKIWPLKFNVCGQVFLLDVYDSGMNCISTRLRTEEEVVEGFEYPIDRKDDLYEAGLELLKIQLEKYAESIKSTI